MQVQATSLFEGLSDQELQQLLEGRARRRFRRGAIVIAEGEQLHELYVVESGTVEVFIAGALETQYLVNRLGPGATLGEMSLVTGQATSATVRATTELELLVLGEAEFHEAAERFPRIHRNIGAILSEKLARADRRHLSGVLGRVSVLEDHGAPPLLGYGLACSLAWHTQSTVLLVDLEHSEGLATLATMKPDSLFAPPAEPRAYLLRTAPSGEFAADAIAQTVDRLRHLYDDVLLQATANQVLPLEGRRLSLLGGSTPWGPTGGYALRGDELSVSGRNPDAGGLLRIPRLGRDEEQALRNGVLPPTSPPGAAIGWAARHLAGLKVGLALGAGSWKGYAHVGALSALERAGVTIDYVGGTSIGAGVAAAYAAGFSLDGILQMLDEVGAAAWRLTVPLRGMLSGAGLRAGLRRFSGDDARIEDQRIPLAIVAADIVTQSEIVFREGLAWPAMLASMSIPGVWPAVRMGSHILVDGGVVNPVPSDVVSAMGADVVIAVSLGSQKGATRVEVRARAGEGRSPYAFQTTLRAIEIMQSKISAISASAATVLIEPDFSDMEAPGLRHFSGGRQAIGRGEAAALAASPRIAAVLPWVRG
jgi:NTE family protein